MSCVESRRVSDLGAKHPPQPLTGYEFLHSGQISIAGPAFMPKDTHGSADGGSEKRLLELV